MNTIHLEILTPEKTAYIDEADMVTVPSSIGTIGVLPKHIPLFSQLIEGEVKIKKKNDETFLSIGGGFIEVTKEKVMVLVTRAMHAADLNEKEILEARYRAEEALKQKPTGKDLTVVQSLLRQSITDLRIIRKRRLVKV